MSNWYHCIECGYYWQSDAFQYSCPLCGARAYMMLKMIRHHSSRLTKFLELLNQDKESFELYKRTKQKTHDEQELPISTTLTPNIWDNIRKLECMYNNGNEKIRDVIHKFFQDMKVDGGNGDALMVQLSDEGTIEIVSLKSSRIVPWNYLTDTERRALWQQFNNLLEMISAPH